MVSCIIFFKQIFLIFRIYQIKIPPSTKREIYIYNVYVIIYSVLKEGIHITYNIFIFNLKNLHYFTPESGLFL